MYYYGYSGGYGYNSPCQSYNQGGYVYPVNTGYGYNNGSGAAIILVLFILLVIVIGAGFFRSTSN